MKLVTLEQPLSIHDLYQYVLEWGTLVKAVIDIQQSLMIVGVALHVDAEQELLEKYHATQSALRGINFYPDQFGKKGFVEFDSMINLRPRDNNKTRGIDDPKIRKQITMIVKSLIIK